VGLQKLATATNTSERTVQRAIEYLERRGLISRQGARFGGSIKGIQFRVRVPPGEDANLTTQDNMTTVAKMATLANLASIKDDDLLNTNHHQSANDLSFPQPHVSEPQHARSARRESGYLQVRVEHLRQPLASRARAHLSTISHKRSPLTRPPQKTLGFKPTS
jgi:DNA-binding transcriptional MocR family regulator